MNSNDRDCTKHGHQFFDYEGGRATCAWCGVLESVGHLPEPPRFVINMADLNEPMERWARQANEYMERWARQLNESVQLNEYVQAVSVALERTVKRP